MAAPVAIAIVSWNTRELLEKCLRSIGPEIEAGRAEAWVVDNASEDGSPELVRERFPEVELIAARENLGFGAATNLVAERTETSWIAPANADIELMPGALQALLAAGEQHPRAGALAPQLLLPDGSAQHSVYSFPTLPFTTLFNLGVQRLSPRLGDRLCLEGYWRPDRPRRVDWAIGAFLLVRRTAWVQVGGFSREQWMYAEDLDLGWRLARHGWSTRYVPSSRVLHRSGAATGQVWGDATTPQWMASTYAWMLRRRGGMLTRLVAIINICGAAGRWAVFGVASMRNPQRWGWRRASMRRWVRLHLIGLRRRDSLLRHR